MKVADTKEERLRSHYVEQLNKLDYFDTEDKSLYQLNNILSRIRRVNQFNKINRDSPDNSWFE